MATTIRPIFTLSKSFFSLNFVGLLRLLMCGYADENQWVQTANIFIAMSEQKAAIVTWITSAFYPIQRNARWKRSGRNISSIRTMNFWLSYLWMTRKKDRRFFLSYLFNLHNFGFQVSYLKLKRIKKKRFHLRLSYIKLNQNGPGFFLFNQSFHFAVILFSSWKHQSEYKKSE